MAGLPSGSDETLSGFASVSSAEELFDFAETPVAFDEEPSGFAEASSCFAEALSCSAEAPSGFAKAPSGFAEAPSGFVAAPSGFAEAPAGFAGTLSGFAEAPSKPLGRRRLTMASTSSWTMSTSSSSTLPFVVWLAPSSLSSGDFASLAVGGTVLEEGGAFSGGGTLLGGATLSGGAGIGGRRLRNSASGVGRYWGTLWAGM